MEDSILEIQFNPIKLIVKVHKKKTNQDFQITGEM